MKVLFVKVIPFLPPEGTEASQPQWQRHTDEEDSAQIDEILREHLAVILHSVAAGQFSHLDL